MTKYYETLSGLHAHVWDTLVQGIVDPAQAAHLPTFVTVSPYGWPEARTVVLRGCDSETNLLWVHTDLQSPKTLSLQLAPRAAFHIWDAKQKLQIRLQADVVVQTGAILRPIWNNLPPHKQRDYGVSPAPGEPIDTGLGYVRRVNPDTFSVLECKIITMDIVHLGEDHRRAAYSHVDDWAGQWLSP